MACFWWGGGQFCRLLSRRREVGEGQEKQGEREREREIIVTQVSSRKGLASFLYVRVYGDFVGLCVAVQELGACFCMCARYGFGYGAFAAPGCCVRHMSDKHAHTNTHTHVHAKSGPNRQYRSAFVFRFSHVGSILYVFHDLLTNRACLVFFGRLVH